VVASFPSKDKIFEDPKEYIRGILYALEVESDKLIVLFRGNQDALSARLADRLASVYYDENMTSDSEIRLSFAIGGLLLGYFLHTRNYEFEYSFFDDEVRFAKIINKSRRKKLPGYKMAEVMAIAPKGHDRVSQYEKDNTAAVRNLCSGFKDARIYVMAAKDKDGIELVYFEPDETYLNEICKRYPSRVTK
jgi:hypothetical protein